MRVRTIGKFMFNAFCASVLINEPIRAADPLTQLTPADIAGVQTKSPGSVAACGPGAGTTGQNSAAIAPVPTQMEYSVDFPKSRLKFRATSVGHSLDCPADIAACGPGVKAAGPIVLDPGHDELPGGNRSDATVVPAGANPRTPTLTEYDPAETPAVDRKKLEAAAAGENQTGGSKKLSPFIHEGIGNLVTAMLTKGFLDRCLFKDMAEKPAVKLTHWPTEGGKNFGTLEDPAWAGEVDKHLHGGLHRVSAETQFENVNKPSEPGKIFDSNSDYGGPYNERVLWANHLLGVANPFVTRVFTQEEMKLSQAERDRLTAEKGVFDPRDPRYRSSGYFLSFHADTAPIRLEPGQKASPELRSQDVIGVVYPRVPQVEGPLPENRFQLLSGAHAKDANPEGMALAQDLAQAALQRTSGLYPKPPTVEARAQGLAVLGRNLLTPHKLLFETYQMTGGYRDEAERQIREKGRHAEVEVTRADGTRETRAYDFSDVQIEAAKAAMEFFGRQVCPK